MEIETDIRESLAFRNLQIWLEKLHKGEDLSGQWEPATAVVGKVTYPHVLQSHRFRKLGEDGVYLIKK